MAWGVGTPWASFKGTAMDCLHSRRKYSAENWICRACGDVEASGLVAGSPFKGVPTICIKGDPNEVPVQARMRNKRHDPRKSASDIERGYAKNIADLRDAKAQGALKRGEDARLLGRIPGELFFAKQNQDKEYWRTPGNLERHKDFLVDK